LRFFVRDREESILGVAEGHPDLSAAKETTQSTRIRSRMLADSLERQFDDLWKSAKVMSIYVDEIIQAAMPCTKMEVRNWFSAIDCDRLKLDATLAANCSIYGQLPEDVGQPNPNRAST
jgi:hypothetical protein